MIDEQSKDVNLAHAAADDLNELAKLMPNQPVAPAHGIAAIALSMALKYHDISIIKDGVLYQQYKLENRNIESIHLDHVLATAERLEVWLLGASDRIAKLIVDAVEFHVENDPKPDEKKDEGLD